MAEVIIDLLEKKLEFFDKVNEKYKNNQMTGDYIKKHYLKNYYRKLKERVYETDKCDRFGCER